MNTLKFKCIPFSRMIIGNKYLLTVYHPKIMDMSPGSIHKPNEYVGVLVSIMDGYPQFHILKTKHNLSISSTRIEPREQGPFVVSIYEMSPVACHDTMVKIIRQKVDEYFAYPIDILPHVNTVAWVYFKYTPDDDMFDNWNIV